ncbi:related to GDSL-like lipase/acylhydrolase domain protein [Rhynchosporium agropyri]|uniref:Related to GDSL-like lipase/acylhydrolase domain protein n=1 Tax=Rhynchosporium agropyri TaxID=914238 RepID=A0A1E1LAW9_9HELO|nr:related to GDSL-like lipase/acylhydrolase domain protein [Rhynchosporium agropyri]
MRCSLSLGQILALTSSFSQAVLASIVENGHIRDVHFPNTLMSTSLADWNTYAPNASELSYKGRWDSRYISWWSAPGLKFGVTGNQVAISFGNWTSPGVLVGFRFDGLDWTFTNITASATHLFSSPEIGARDASVFEIRVSNYAYGIQIRNVRTAPNSTLFKVPDFKRRLEVIGDSLASGYTATYEGLAGFGYGLAAGLGETEWDITSYSGICLHDRNCWGNPRGQTYQWYQTSDTSPRSREIYGTEPEPWDFAKHPAADLVVICLGTNDNNSLIDVASEDYVKSYIELVDGVHEKYPKANIVLMSLWSGFSKIGTTYRESGAFISEIYDVYKYFNTNAYVTGTQQPFVHYFNSTGILQHNDINPQFHPTDVGHVKLASHLLQYVKMKFDWGFAATGPEVQHETLYWNDLATY